MGNIAGRVLDASTSAGVSGASILVTDAQGKEYRTSTDGSGNFRVEGVVPGGAKVRTESERHLLNTESTTVEARKDAQLTINLNPRPKQANVVVTQTQIVIKKQINFETDSAVIKGDSSALLQEIADVMSRNANLKLVEVQGHTDNTGSREHNQDLSERRANAVKEWLIANGIESGRLESKGYGQTRPIAPNVTAGNRARNRRVQFVIKERD
jgi:outer membrane protein OmpA-like peptidoglycan-associated protein